MHVTDLGLDGPRRVIDLSQPFEVGMPCSPTHPGFEMSIEVAHGDVLRSDGITGSHEKITFGDHVGTHVDALCHVAVDGAIFPMSRSPRPSPTEGTSSAASSRCHRMSGGRCSTTCPACSDDP